jgi:hypothetical protein
MTSHANTATFPTPPVSKRQMVNITISPRTARWRAQPARSLPGSTFAVTVATSSRHPRFTRAAAHANGTSIPTMRVTPAGGARASRVTVCAARPFFAMAERTARATRTHRCRHVGDDDPRRDHRRRTQCRADSACRSLPRPRRAPAGRARASVRGQRAARSRPLVRGSGSSWRRREPFTSRSTSSLGLDASSAASGHSSSRSKRPRACGSTFGPQCHRRNSGQICTTKIVRWFV